MWASSGMNEHRNIVHTTTGEGDRSEYYWGRQYRSYYYSAGRGQGIIVHITKLEGRGQGNIVQIISVHIIQDSASQARQRVILAQSWTAADVGNIY